MPWERLRHFWIYLLLPRLSLMTAHDSCLYHFCKNTLPSSVLIVYLAHVRTFFHVVLRLLLHVLCIQVSTFLSSLQSKDSCIAG